MQPRLTAFALVGTMACGNYGPPQIPVFDRNDTATSRAFCAKTETGAKNRADEQEG
jgi:hypothetical protein